MTLVNHGSRPREVELTSFAEVCLNHRRADQAHPAFAKLFLETEFDPGSGSLLARRRPRSANEKPVWAIHRSATDAPASERIEYETDRVRFLGRGRTPGNPAALDRGVRPVADDRPGAGSGLQLAAPRSPRAGGAGAHRVRDRGGRHPGGGAGDCRTVPRPRGHRPGIRRRQARCHDELREMSLTPGDVALFDRLAAAVIFTSPGLRQPEAVAANRLGQPGLWPHAHLGRPAHRAGPGRGGRR